MASARVIWLGLALGTLLRGRPSLGTSADTVKPRESERLRKRKQFGEEKQRAYDAIGRLVDFVTNVHLGAGKFASREYGYCQIKSTSDCSIASLGKNQWTVIDPAGEGSPYKVGQNMECIDSSRFRFKFWRGSSSKLLIYLQGGGACWNQWSTQGLRIPGVLSWGPLCSFNATSQLGYETGPLNMSNSSNPFRNHSVLFVPYCSGDVFSGDRIQPYSVQANNESSPKAVQKGYRHLLAAVTWLQGNGDFSQNSTLSDFTLQGCSAGTIGSQVWANDLLGRFSYRDSRVVLDSYAGILPVDKQAQILASWGTCDLPILTPEQQAACKKPQGLFIVDLTVTALGSHNTTRFVTINSKIDQVQREYYTLTKYDTERQILLAVELYGPAALGPLENTTYYRELNQEVLRTYAVYDNWQGFIVDGDPHCFNSDDWIVSSDVIGGSFYSGPLGFANDTGTPLIPVNLEQVYAANSPSYVCEGVLLDPAEAGDSVAYCDINLR